MKPVPKFGSERDVDRGNRGASRIVTFHNSQFQSDRFLPVGNEKRQVDGPGNDFFLPAGILRRFLLTNYGFNELVYHLGAARVTAERLTPGM